MNKGSIKYSYEGLKQLGYELIKEEYNDKILNRYVTVKDNEGYVYRVINSELSKYQPRKFHSSNPYTINNLNLYLIKINFPFKLISTNYINSQTNLLFLDESGYYAVQNLSRILQGNMPQKFAKNNPYTLQNIRLWLKLNKLQLELISNKYEGSTKNLIFKDNQGFYYSCCWGNLQTFGININSGIVGLHNPYSIQNIKLWCKLNNKPYELLSDTYIGYEEKLLWKCLKEDCNEEFPASWHSIYVSSHGCPYCAGQKLGLSNCLVIKRPDFASEWHPTLNGNLTPWDVYVGSNQYVWWKCNKCGFEWYAKISFRYHSNTQCPECSKESKGELKVQEVVNRYNLYNSSKYIFNDCRDKYPLPFDRAIYYDKNNTNLQLLIEYDGKQHFEPVCFGGISIERAKNNLKLTQFHDKIKDEYCIKDNIILIRIPYWEFNNIETILEDILIKDNMCSKYIVNNWTDEINNDRDYLLLKG